VGGGGGWGGGGGGGGGGGWVEVYDKKLTNMGGKRGKIQFEYVDFLENTLLHTEVRQIRENMAQIELMLQKAYTYFPFIINIDINYFCNLVLFHDLFHRFLYFL
jgi:hypothetical protein